MSYMNRMGPLQARYGAHGQMGMGQPQMGMGQPQMGMGQPQQVPGWQSPWGRPAMPQNQSIPFGQPIAEPSWSAGQPRMMGGPLQQTFSNPGMQPQTALRTARPSQPGGNGANPALFGNAGGGMPMMPEGMGPIPQTGGMVDRYDATGRVIGQQFRPSNLVDEEGWRAANTQLFPVTAPIYRNGRLTQGRVSGPAVFNSPEMVALRQQAGVMQNLGPSAPSMLPGQQALQEYQQQAQGLGVPGTGAGSGALRNMGY